MSKGVENLQDDWYSTEKVIIYDTPAEITGGVIKKVGEILDIYTEFIADNGSRIYMKSEQMEREEAHRIGALHTGAQIWVYNSKGKVLLQKRAMTVKSSRGLLDTSAAGHITNGNTVIFGALSELKQEIGLIRKPEDLVHIGNYRRETKKITKTGFQHNNEINKVFLLSYEGELSRLKKQDSEVAELMFITLEQLEEEWNNPKKLALYTSKGEQYRQMVLSNIKKILGITL